MFQKDDDDLFELGEFSACLTALLFYNNRGLLCTNVLILIFFIQQNFAAQYDGSKAPDAGPGPMVRTPLLLPPHNTHLQLF